MGTKGETRVLNTVTKKEKIILNWRRTVPPPLTIARLDEEIRGGRRTHLKSYQVKKSGTLRGELDKEGGRTK